MNLDSCRLVYSSSCNPLPSSCRAILDLQSLSVSAANAQLCWTIDAVATSFCILQFQDHPLASLGSETNRLAFFCQSSASLPHRACPTSRSSTPIMAGTKDDDSSGSGGFMDDLKDKLRDSKLHDAKVSLIHQK